MDCVVLLSFALYSAYKMSGGVPLLMNSTFRSVIRSCKAVLAKSAVGHLRYAMGKGWLSWIRYIIFCSFK